jgi:16S rRNA G966 N2-methylase RsmD
MIKKYYVSTRISIIWRRGRVVLLSPDSPEESLSGIELVKILDTFANGCTVKDALSSLSASHELKYMETTIRRLIHVRALVNEADLLGYPEISWTTGAIKIQYRPLLDAGGTVHAPILARYLKERFNTCVENALEVFCGPGFIGFHLISQKIAKKITFTDINAIAIQSVLETIRSNNLTDKCFAYCGDNLDPLPTEARFNLVVGNPPWSLKCQDDANGLLESDPGWHIHRAFYSKIAEYLCPGGMVVLLEWKPNETTPSGSGREFWDIRPRPPQVDFLEMIEAGGLQHIETAQLEGGWNGLHAVVSFKIG